MILLVFQPNLSCLNSTCTTTGLLGAGLICGELADFCQESGGGEKGEGFAGFRFLEEAKADEGGEVVAGGLTGKAVTAGVLLERIAAARRVAEGVGEEGELAVVEGGGGRGREECRHLTALGGLAAGEVVKGAAGAFEGVELVDDKIGEVIVVGGNMEKGAAIGGGTGAQDGG